MKKILTIVLAVITMFSSVMCVGAINIVTTQADALNTNTQPSSVSTYKVTKPKKLKKVTIKKVSVVKKVCDNTFLIKYPKITWKKVKNATRYRIACQKPGSKKWVYMTSKKTSLVFTKKVDGDGKYKIKVRAESNNSIFTKGDWSKVKTITIKDSWKALKKCQECGKRKGYGNGKCQHYTSDGWCSYCCKKVTAYKCHSCTNANPKKAYCIYDHDTGKIKSEYTIWKLKADGVLVEGMKYY